MAVVLSKADTTGQRRPVAPLDGAPCGMRGRFRGTV